MQTKLLRIRQVQEATGRSRSSIYIGIRDGTFPLPVRVGARAIAWHAHEVAAWIESRPRAGADA